MKYAADKNHPIYTQAFADGERDAIRLTEMTLDDTIFKEEGTELSFKARAAVRDSQKFDEMEFLVKLYPQKFAYLEGYMDGMAKVAKERQAAVYQKEFAKLPRCERFQMGYLRCMRDMKELESIMDALDRDDFLAKIGQLETAVDYNRRRIPSPAAVGYLSAYELLSQRAENLFPLSHEQRG